MSDFPRTFGVFVPGGWLTDLWRTREAAERRAEEAKGCRPAMQGPVIQAVELITLPEHEAIVAAAVAAERERCAGIAEERECNNASEVAAGLDIADKIREVTK